MDIEGERQSFFTGLDIEDPQRFPHHSEELERAFVEFQFAAFQLADIEDVVYQQQERICRVIRRIEIELLL